ncbi:MAG: 30S ribosomal protein S20 [Deltaproteobacteria bacterium]|nr:MAG: 30S ribosomal protein S20 [Deltaproteobacteria bacterium]
MANHPSAEKRARQSLRRRTQNRSVRARVRSFVKDFRTAVEAGDAEAAETQLRATERELRKAASKGVLKPKWVSRNVSRLAKQLDRARSSA